MEEKENFSQMIRRTLKEDGRKIGWLSEKITSMGRTTLWNKMKYDDFNKEEQKEILKILGKDGSG